MPDESEVTPSRATSPPNQESQEQIDKLLARIRGQWRTIRKLQAAQFAVLMNLARESVLMRQRGLDKDTASLLVRQLELDQDEVLLDELDILEHQVANDDLKRFFANGLAHPEEAGGECGLEESVQAPQGPSLEPPPNSNPDPDGRT